MAIITQWSTVRCTEEPCVCVCMHVFTYVWMYAYTRTLLWISLYKLIIAKSKLPTIGNLF